MSYEISRHKDFDVSIKRLAKRYRSISDDYEDFLESLEENPFQGAELCPGIRKIRMSIASKGRGKSGGARVITANAIVAEHEGRIALLTIYDKEGASTVKLNVIKQMARELGFNV
ncbi:MAG: addiction module toxin RelE [Prevotella sp.]|nr:addiction module toxin RelE [Prevotella sp.]